MQPLPPVAVTGFVGLVGQVGLNHIEKPPSEPATAFAASPAGIRLGIDSAWVLGGGTAFPDSFPDAPDAYRTHCPSGPNPHAISRSPLFRTHGRIPILFIIE
jgi:hypothetical protein